MDFIYKVSQFEILTPHTSQGMPDASAPGQLGPTTDRPTRHQAMTNSAPGESQLGTRGKSTRHQGKLILCSTVSTFIDIKMFYRQLTTQKNKKISTSEKRTRHQSFICSYQLH